MTRHKSRFLAILFLLVSFFVTLPVSADNIGNSQSKIEYVGDGTIEVSVALQKLDKDTKERLSGATFELRDEGGKTVAVDESLTTDENGEIHLDRLQPGKYTFVETKSPTGYQLDGTPLPFEVDFDKTDVTVIAYNQKQTSPQNNQTEPSKTEQPKAEQPKKQGILPSTGMKSTTGLVVLGLLILMVAIYLIVTTRRKNTNNDK